MGLYRYAVQQRLIPGLPQVPYTDGVGHLQFVVLHDTACDGDSAPAEAAYEARTWDSVKAYVCEFIDHSTIIQVSDPRYRQWGAGPTANAEGVHLELCHDNTKAGFGAAFDRWCERAALYLFARGLGVKDGITLMSHAQVSQKWHETDHMDPNGYLARFGVCWDDVVHRVSNYYAILEQESKSGKFGGLPDIPKECQTNPLLQPAPVHYEVRVFYFDGTEQGCPAAEDAAKKIRALGYYCEVHKSTN